MPDTAEVTNDKEEAPIVSVSPEVQMASIKERMGSCKTLMPFLVEMIDANFEYNSYMIPQVRLLAEEFKKIKEDVEQLVFDMSRFYKTITDEATILVQVQTRLKLLEEAQDKQETYL